MKHLAPIAFTLACFSLAPLTHAQQTQIEDEVIATGTIRGGDPAMGAFFSGDFETAEIEFQKNFRRIKRDNMQTRHNAASASSTTFTSEIIAGPGATSGNGGGANNVQSNTVPQSLGTIAGRAQRTGEGALSGTDLGFQKYMIAMSQLQLRKYDEAKENFKTAITMNKSLYDANLRLGLLEMRDGNLEAAQKMLQRLNKQVKRCRNVCKERIELTEAQQTLATALGKARS